MSGHHLPEVLMKKVDEYVDSLAPQIQPKVEAELEIFQTKTIDSLEDQIVTAFRSLFDKDDDGSGKHGLDSGVPDSYGGQSLPFADEISKLTRSFSDLSRGASSDLKDIFDLTEGGGNNNNNATRAGPGQTTRSGSGGDMFKTFISSAVDVVQDQLEKKNIGVGGQKIELDGLLGVISNTVKEAARNPEEKARMITPEIKEKVAAEMREQHKPIAERFTKIALEHIKKWLRGNTSTRDLGDGARGEIEDQVKDLVKGIGGLFGSKKHHGGEGQSRGLFGSSDGDRAGPGGEEKESRGFSKIISEKLSTGLARVHREVRLEFRKVLAEIEKKLFELLPDKFQKPLEKILGGNPFDAQLDKETTGERGFGDDIKTKLLSKIRDLIKKVQETLRESILGVVNGGHRKFEKQSWVFVQNMVEQKVQKYLPKVKITVPDDIGDEGVSVGAPTNNIQLGGGHQAIPSPAQQQQQQQKPPQTSFAPPPQQGGSTQAPPPQQPYAPPPQQGGSTQAPPPQQSYAPPPTQSTYPPPSSQNYPPPPSQNYSPQTPVSQHQPQQQHEQQTYRPPSQGSGQQHHQQYQPQTPQQQSYQPAPQHDQPNQPQQQQQQQQQHQSSPGQHQYQPYRPPTSELDSSPIQPQAGGQQYYPPPPPGPPPHQQSQGGYNPQEYKPQPYNPQPYRPGSGGGESQNYGNQ